MTLPIRRLILSESADRELENRLWTDQYLSAAMRIGGSTVPVKVRYRGGHTREYPKRSYDIVRGGLTYHYNAEFDDPSMIRNALSFAFFPMLGVHAPKCRHVLLYRNDDFQGVYLEIESVGRSFFKRRGIGAAALFYAINNNADFGLMLSESGHLKSSLLSGYEHRFGGAAEKARFAAFIRGINRKDGRARSFIANNLDTDNYLRWLAGAVLTGNYDGFEQNYAIYRHSRSGKYRNIPWDYEGTWGRDCYGHLQDDRQVPVKGYNVLTDKLMAYRGYRDHYRKILRQALNGPFQEQRIMPIVRKLAGQIAPYYRMDPMRRWSYAEFLGEPELIRRYIRVRREIIEEEMKSLSK